jgi:glycosyltransferase involved in cell wall biosynthesis
MVSGSKILTRTVDMKILLIAGFAESLINFRGPLIRALQGKGFDVHVAAPNVHANKLICLQLNTMGLWIHQVPLQRTGTNPFADLRLAWSLFILLRKIAPDMVLSYTIKPVIYGTFAAWVAGVPKRFALITGLGYSFQGDGRRAYLQTLVQRLYRLALAKAQCVFFQNKDDLSLFQTRNLLSLNTSVCVINGSGVDLNSYAVRPFPKTDLLGGVKFLFIGRLLGDKGIREYVQAAHMVKVKFPNAKFMLVGALDSNPNSISKSELESWLASSNVEFLGSLVDVRAAIEGCNVYVLPSYREGTPRTVLEAMSMGRPIITTDAPGCRETVLEGENGFLVPVKDVDALVKAMEKFILDSSLIPIMGKRSREIAEEKYDVQKVNAVMLNAMGIA